MTDTTEAVWTLAVAEIYAQAARNQQRWFVVLRKQGGAVYGVQGPKSVKLLANLHEKDGEIVAEQV